MGARDCFQAKNFPLTRASATIADVLIYAAAIFIGAFLLFQVQPLIGKYILPWFGGGPGVWNTCMLFFQVLLLAGYAYAYAITRWLRPRQQAIIHLGLLALAVLLLPIVPDAAWRPPDGSRPVWRILLLLGATVGLPYFVLSSTGPLLQHWFSRTHPERSPYRLYALSNIGSLLALLSYPFLVEVRFTRNTQAGMWGYGLLAFALVCGLAAWRFGFRSRPAAQDPEPNASTADEQQPAGGTAKWLWFLLPACASILLLAITNKLCLDIAALPFLWVAPLSLYLLSFILCFDSPRWYRRIVFIPVLVIGLPWFVWTLQAGSDWPLWGQIAAYCGALFVACMVCHGELYHLRPAPARLAGYYLALSAGGAAGGVFVALVAPLMFDDYYELPIGIVLCALLLFATQARNILRVPWPAGELLQPPALAGRATAFAYWPFLVTGFIGVWAAAVTATLWTKARAGSSTSVYQARNFYGVVNVHEYNRADPLSHYVLLQHGRITHGIQFTDPAQSKWPSSYYGEESGIGRAFASLPGNRKVGLVGLGTGTSLTFTRAGDSVRIYEIDPQVVRIARSHFTYLESTDAAVELVMGDARLSLEREPPGDFDLLILDAFSSDAIPVHLLTREAFALYARHLKPDGVIAVHVSNRFLDLEPVVYTLGRHFNFHVAAIDYGENEDEWWVYTSTWMLLTRNGDWINTPLVKDASKKLPAASPSFLWTDDYSSVFRILLKN